MVPSGQRQRPKLATVPASPAPADDADLADTDTADPSAASVGADQANDFLAKAEGNLVDIYSRMRPDAAAERLAEVNVELAAGILMKLQARQAGIILNEMDSKAAAKLTGIMASAARRQDPT